MAEDVVAALQRTNLFGGLKPKELARIAQQGKVVTFKPGAEITEEGGRGVGFHLIIDGGAVVQVGGVKRRDVGVGDYFGEVSLIDGQPRTATVSAGPDGATTFALAAWDFTPLVTEYPEVAVALLKTLCSRLRSLEAALVTS